MENNSNVVILAVNSSTQDLLASIKSFKAAGVKNIMMFDSAKYGFVPVLDASVKLFHTDKALLDEITKLDGFVYVTRRFNAPKDFVKIAFNDSRNETDAYGFTGYKLLRPVDERIPNVEVAWFNRKPNAPRYLKNDSGDEVVDYFPETGFMVHSSRMSELCKSGVLRVFDSHVRATTTFKDAGMRLVCMDSPWGRPVRLSTRNSGRKYLKADEIIAIRKTAKTAPVSSFTVGERKSINSSSRVIVGLASYPPGETGMLDTVKALSPQCDELHVALNEYSGVSLYNVLEKLSKYKNVIATPYIGPEDLGCQNKFRCIGLCGENDYLLTVDDDILYPNDYVESMIYMYNKIQGDKIVSAHGRTLPYMENGGFDIIKKFKEFFAFHDSVKTLHKVDFIGCGCAICQPQKIGLDFSTFNVPKNTGDDELVCLWSKKTGVPLYVIPHKRNWLKQNPFVRRRRMCNDRKATTNRMEYLNNKIIEIGNKMNDQQPFFRVVIPVYRSAGTLSRALESIKKQTFQSYKVVVCDDMSDEPFVSKNEKVVSGLGDKGLFIRSKRKLYAGGARNLAMEHFKDAKYTLFLDSDDEFTDSKCFEDLHSLITEKNFPDVVVLPSFSDRTNKSNLQRVMLETSPEKFASGNSVEPWSKAVKTSILPKFQEGLRRSNDVLQHWLLVDKVATVVPFTRDFVRYHVDGATTMFGASKQENRKTQGAVVSLLECARALITHRWKHGYTRENVLRTVKHITTRMLPDTVNFIGNDMLSIIGSEKKKESFSQETLIPQIESCSRRFNGRFGKGFVDNPKTIQEKIAHIKILGITELMTKCADKLQVKEYAKEVLGEDISVPTIATWSKPDDIDFDMLPDKFALKCNHGCHYNIIVPDKSALNRVEAVEKLKRWMNDDYGWRFGELQYMRIPRMCFAEKYVGDGKETTDYKFVCFNGAPTYCQIIAHRGTPKQHLNWYDMDFKLAPISRTDFVQDPNDIDKKPVSFERMKKYAEKLAKPFDFVRVDFFELDGRPYLGELTFTPANALQHYKNDQETGLMLGNMLKLS